MEAPGWSGRPSQSGILAAVEDTDAIGFSLADATASCETISFNASLGFHDSANFTLALEMGFNWSQPANQLDAVPVDVPAANEASVSTLPWSFGAKYVTALKIEEPHLPDANPASWPTMSPFDYGGVMKYNHADVTTVCNDRDDGSVWSFANSDLISIEGSAASDFNGDGHSDILWRSDSGAIAIWDSGQISAAHFIADAGAFTSSWHISGTGDFNDNDQDDIFWHDRDTFFISSNNQNPGTDSFIFDESRNEVIDSDFASFVQKIDSGIYLRPLSVREIEGIARDLRNKFGFQDILKIDIVSILEFEISKLFPTFNFRVIENESDTQDVLALAQFDPLEIVVKESVYQQAVNEHPEARFVLAHELGHVVLHCRSNHRAHILFKEAGLDDGFEWEANRFAEAFLMPFELVNTMRPEDITSNFGVTESTAQSRLRQFGIDKKAALAGVAREDGNAHYSMPVLERKPLFQATFSFLQ